MKVGIIGYGWVGKSMHQLFPNAMIYDPHNYPVNIDFPTKTVIHTKEDINECDVAFIGVPTPNANNTDIAEYAVVRGEGALDTSIVESVIAWCEAPLIVVRSTVNPGDCDRWTEKYKKHIVFQPEYLGETPNHPLINPKDRPFMIIGGEKEDRRKLIELYVTVYNANVTIELVTNLEAEVIKLSENRAIAFKVAQCQELYDVCELAHLDYYKIRDAVYSNDPRFNLWWTFVFPDKRGMNSKCIPKDVYAWCAFAESLGYEPKITRALLEKNKSWIKLNEEN